ncbi:hypothetical protein [Corynebacterium sp. KPL4072]|uniref:hypothetical protein n=1 Tax=Corynebacterium sp. KPL4072 TaxID=3135440 RepID=UPI0030C988C4
MPKHAQNIIHPQQFQLDRGITHSPWYIRQTIYTITGIIALTVTAFGIASPDQVDTWLQNTSGITATIASALAAITTGEHSDYRPTPTQPPQDTSPAAQDTPTAPAPQHPTPNHPQGATPGHPAPNPQQPPQ